MNLYRRWIKSVFIAAGFLCAGTGLWLAVVAPQHAESTSVDQPGLLKDLPQLGVQLLGLGVCLIAITFIPKKDPRKIK